MIKFLDIKLDASQLGEVAEYLGRLGPEDIHGLSMGVVNKVSASVHAHNIDRITDELNLSRGRVESDLQLRLATPEQRVPTAFVASPMRNVTLGSFDPNQHSKPVTWSNARIQGMGKKFSNWPGWTERKGDTKRGIAPDYKADGIDVTVKRGSPKDIDGGFTMTLRAGRAAGSNVGVFTRDSSGKLTHRYGPAVYQLFRNYVKQDEAEIQDELTAEFLAGLDTKLRDPK